MNTDTKKIIVSDAIEKLIPYPPGKPIEELERELGIEGSIKLASNENPVGPSPKAIAAVTAGLGELNRYPDGSGFYLKRRLSEKLGVGADTIALGNGSNEIIELLVRTFISTGDEAVMGDPSFAVYPLVMQAAGGVSVKVPLKDLTIDLGAVLAAVTAKTRLIFLANPNNPTGTAFGASELDAFMEKLPEGVIVCLDEAYYEYVRSGDFPDSLKYIKDPSLTKATVVVLRTFSKIYGLAGLRIGYGVSSPELIDYLDRVRQPFNAGSLGQRAALAAIDDTEHVERSRQCNSEGLEYLFKALGELGYDCVPTEANFFLIKVGDGKALYGALLKEGVIVRQMQGYGLPEYLRITVGTMDENRRLVDTIKKLAV
ncbi:Histidinol-phosphate aminotransferase [hydrothermal vent metagenome]|uniref:Histidinol-phosphate aminotransferase n=1 Tax=hydrothermal vent metagenome TaxID=652676 RepID=A0A3B0RGD6_9ZZZZ